MIRRAALLLVVYAAVALICRLLAYGTLALDPMTLVVLLAVPLAQALAIEGLVRWRRTGGQP